MTDVSQQAQSVEQIRRDSEQQAERLAELALEYVLLTQSTPSTLDDKDMTRPLMQFPQPLRRAATTLAKLSVAAAVSSVFRGSAAGTSRPAYRRVGVPSREVQSYQDDVTEDLIRKAASIAREAAKDKPELLVPRTPDDHEQRRAWTRRVGVTTATEANSDAAIRLAPAVAESTGVEMRTMWVSRGDSRVRELHRRLHAQTRKPGDPYWTELSSGKKLSYPGDPHAPLDQTINCRCGLILVPAPEATAASDMLTMTDQEFALAASAHEPDDVDWLLHKVLRSQRRLSTLRHNAV